MISDDPDEDADNIDDEDLLEAYSDGEKPASSSPTASTVTDWPGRSMIDVKIGVDYKTIAWFQANHADWRGEIHAVLRSWANMHKKAPPDA
jgi:uncharacterized protein (DUF4415 family)